MKKVCYACENASSRLTQTDPDRREWRGCGGNRNSKSGKVDRRGLFGDRII